MGEVHMKPKAVTNEQKLAYENEGLKKLNRELYDRIQNMNMVNLFKRLDYLFKVVELKDSFNSDFVIKCTDEIQEALDPKEEDIKEEE